MPLHARFAATPPPLTADLSHAAWEAALPHVIDRAWNGQAAPAALATTARLIWTATHLWCAFDCAFLELDADAGPDVDTTVARHALWERDVCEIFVRSPREPHDQSYKEFEVAPSGQWIDLAIHEPRVDVDLGWRSGMQTAAAVDAAARRFIAVMRVPFSAFGGPPEAGKPWHANLFRIARVDGTRQFLTWSPTGTPVPDFHVPRAFVPLVFEPAR